MDDFVVKVRQVYQYPLRSPAVAGDVLLGQVAGPLHDTAGPYKSFDVLTLIQQARQQGGWIGMDVTDGIAWGNATLTWNSTTGFTFWQGPVSAQSFLTAGNITAGGSISAGEVLVNGQPLATQQWVSGIASAIVNDSVLSFMGRTGNVQLELPDILRGGGAPILSPSFRGMPTAPSPWNVWEDNDRLATTHWAQRAICANLERMLTLQTVTSFNGRFGKVILDTEDVNKAYFADPRSRIKPRAPTPPPYDASTRIATTQFVDDAVAEAKSVVIIQMDSNVQGVLDYLNLNFAPVQSPQLQGIPTAPTASVGSATGQIATTAFVANAVSANIAGVSSFNTRTGDITLTALDIDNAGGAPLDSPAFTGTPTAVTAPDGTSTNQLATTGFVMSQITAIDAGVLTFNNRSGAVSLQAGDITGAGGALLASPALSGTPTAPTAAQTVNNTQLATTAYVRAAIAAAPGGVSSWNGRTGAITLQWSDVSAVGGAPLASPAFTGTPTSTTPGASDNSTNIATTAWVQSRLASFSAGVTTFNGRAGAVTMTAADITGANGALYYQADSAPTPGYNKFWFDSVGGQLYVNYIDPVTAASSWVIANSPPAPPLPEPAPGTKILLAQQLITTAVASVEWLYDFDNTYDVYEVEILTIECSVADQIFYVRYSWDGATFDSTPNYVYGYVAAGQATTAGANGATSQGAMTIGILPYNQPVYPGTFYIRLFLPWTTDRFKYCMIDAQTQITAGAYRFCGNCGYVGGTGIQPVRGLQFLPASGTLVKGLFNLYGIVKAGAGAT